MLPDSIRSAAPRLRGSAKAERLAVRVSASQKALLDQASRATGSTLSEFVLTAATEAAEDVLADRRRFVMPRQEWSAFVQLLDAPPRSLPRLRGLLESPGVLDDE